MSAALIAELVRALPRQHLHELAYIRYDPPGAPGRVPRPTTSHRGQRVVALYDEALRGLHVFEARDAVDLFESVLHEIGHHLYRRILLPAARRDWGEAVAAREGWVTPYARTDGEEDFVESYMAYLIHPDWLRPLPTKGAYLRDAVFAGRPPPAALDAPAPFA